MKIALQILSPTLAIIHTSEDLGHESTRFLANAICLLPEIEKVEIGRDRKHFRIELINVTPWNPLYTRIADRISRHTGMKAENVLISEFYKTEETSTVAA